MSGEVVGNEVKTFWVIVWVPLQNIRFRVHSLVRDRERFFGPLLSGENHYVHINMRALSIM